MYYVLEHSIRSLINNLPKFADWIFYFTVEAFLWLGIYLCQLNSLHFLVLVWNTVNSFETYRMWSLHYVWCGGESGRQADTSLYGEGRHWVSTRWSPQQVTDSLLYDTTEKEGSLLFLFLKRWVWMQIMTHRILKRSNCVCVVLPLLWSHTKYSINQ